MEIPNAESLQSPKNTNNKIYNPVLCRCIEKVIRASKTTNKSYTIFEIPNFLLGVPQYTISSCVLYLITELSRKNYIVNFIAPNYLHIDWGKRINLDRNSKNIKKILEKNPNMKIEFCYDD